MEKEINVLKANFKNLYEKNVNEYVEKKNGLNYLTWSYAWAEFKKVYPDATYSIKKFENGLPYIYDQNLGYMVFTEVTADGLTYEMWLPVMDNANNAMKDSAYSYKVKKYEYNQATKRREFIGNYEEKEVEPATMFDINKTIMRCLVKNIAMFGLGLYIYAGEDLPSEIVEQATSEQIARIKELNVNMDAVIKRYGVNTLEQLNTKQADFIIKSKEKAIAEENK